MQTSTGNDTAEETTTAVLDHAAVALEPAHNLAQLCRLTGWLCPTGRMRCTGEKLLVRKDSAGNVLEVAVLK